ncbi:MAG: M28 family peptidase [Chitinophagales bacterium]
MGNQVSKSWFIGLFAGLILCLYIGCTGTTSAKQDKTKKKDVPTKPTCQTNAILPEGLEALGDSSYQYVQMQVDFGPRIPETEPHRLCGDQLIEWLSTYCDTVVVQQVQDTLKAFPELQTDSLVKGRNIWAQFNPDITKDRILLAAHWDTRPHADQDSTNTNNPNILPFDGADDGASGVGVLLEIARVLHHLGTDQGVDILFFDLEDYGANDPFTREEINPYCVGSRIWSQRIAENGLSSQYSAGILLDMVGAGDAYFSKERHSTQYASHVLKEVWCLAKNLGYGKLFVDVSNYAVEDDHLYVNTIADIPMIDIINYRASATFADHWHTEKDNMEIIDAKTLHAVRQVVLSYLFSKSESTEPPA